MPEFKGIPSLTDVFDVVPDDYRLGKLFTAAELEEICDNLRIPGHRVWWRKTLMVGAIREHFKQFGDMPPAPTCGEAGCPPEVDLIRWHKADRGEPVLLQFDNSINQVLPGAAAMMMERYNYIASFTERLNFALAGRGQTPDIKVDARESDGDGQGGTLGWALFYEREDSTDLDVFGEQQYSVHLHMDPAEVWTPGFFRTTSGHEAVHTCGIGHNTNDRDSWMWPSYLGERLEMDVWTQDRLIERHGHYRNRQAGIPA